MDPIEGGLHWLQPHRLRGWALVPARPDEHVRIDVLLDGILVAATAASLPSERSARGNGDHGFAATTTARLPLDGSARLEVRATGSRGETCRLILPRRPAAPP